MSVCSSFACSQAVLATDVMLVEAPRCLSWSCKVCRARSCNLHQSCCWLQGLVLPPRVAHTQVVIIPITNAKMSAEEKAAMNQRAQELCQDLRQAGLKVQTDARDNYTPGWKYSHWELMVRLALTVSCSLPQVLTNKACWSRQLPAGSSSWRDAKVAKPGADMAACRACQSDWSWARETCRARHACWSGETLAPRTRRPGLSCLSACRSCSIRYR